MKNRTLLFFLIFLRSFEVLAVTDCTQVTEIPQLECEALIALYNNTNGSSWIENIGWNETNTPCSWVGIFCSGGYVNRIYLYSNGLSGSIPTELGNFSNLRELILDNNQLSGLIPAKLGNISNLELLYLANNQLSGLIPAELGNLSNLGGFSLSNNQLAGSIPAEIGNLGNLKKFNLDNNQLCGDIPLSLINLSNLYSLSLKDNGLNVTNLDPQLEAFFNLINATLEPQNPAICPASLAALAFFKAVSNPSGILLRWQTLSEYENAGFYIWRGQLIGSQCSSRRADYNEVVEVDFKATKGDGFSGASYFHWDDTAKPETTYCYLLGDVDFNRNITPHWDLMTLVTTP